MKVRRYFAATMRSALEQVRQEQGPDVLILSNRKVDGGVELLTAVGEADAELIEKFTPPRPVRERRSEDAVAAAPAAHTPRVVPPPAPAIPDGALWTRQETIDQMQRELGALKNLLENQLSGLAWHDYSNRSPLAARLVRGLAQYGITPKLARSVASLAVSVWRKVPVRSAGSPAGAGGPTRMRIEPSLTRRATSSQESVRAM